MEKPKAESMKRWRMVKDLEPAQGIAENRYFKVVQIEECEGKVYMEIRRTCLRCFTQFH